MCSKGVKMTYDERHLKEKNLVTALQLGLIDWFQFFEMWRKL